MNASILKQIIIEFFTINARKTNVLSAFTRYRSLGLSKQGWARVGQKKESWKDELTAKSPVFAGVRAGASINFIEENVTLSREHTTKAHLPGGTPHACNHHLLCVLLILSISVCQPAQSTEKHGVPTNDPLPSSLSSSSSTTQSKQEKVKQQLSRGRRRMEIKDSIRLGTDQKVRDMWQSLE